MRLNQLIFSYISLFLFGLTIPSAALAQNNPNRNPGSSNVERELIGIAESALRTEYDVQVNGDETAARRRNPNATRVRDRNFQRRLESARNSRSFLRGKKVGFKNVQTSLNIKDFRMEGNVATLEAVENTISFYDLSIMAADSAEKSEEITEHRFTFNLSNRQWELISDEILNAPGSVQGSAEESIPSLPIDPSLVPSDPLAPPTNNQSGLSSVLSSSVKSNQLDVTDSSYPNSEIIFSNPSTSPILISLASLNRQAIIQYIYYYALTPNTQYRDYSQAGNQGGDCTNFVSQALKAGGWPSQQGFYKTNTNWWYDFSIIRPGESWTWINANYFYDFIWKRPRAKTIGRVADLVPGDVISVDLNPQLSNGVDHTMLVSKKASDGTIYLAYHTSNMLDKTFYQFYNESPGAKYYAWSLLSSYE